MHDLSGKPIIQYPCKWTFAVIGTEKVALRLSVAEVLAGLPYEIKPSHDSKTGKYTSFHVEVTVDSEEHRNKIFQALQKQPGVRHVL